MNLLNMLKSLGFKASPFLFVPGEQEIPMQVGPDEMVLVAGASLVQVKPGSVFVCNRQLSPSPGIIVVTPGGKVGAVLLFLMERYGK